MAKIKQVKTNFNAGEFTPLLDGRTDLDRYYNSCRTMKNMIPLPLGSATTRPGFKYIADVEDITTKSYLYPFRAADNSRYMLEFSDLKIRVYGEQARVGSFEVTTPYLIADVPNLKFAQSADTLYMVHEDYAPRKLQRFTNTNWKITTVAFNPGPLKEASYTGSDLTGGTITAAAATGVYVAFTATNAAFMKNDVGRIIRPSPANTDEDYIGAYARIVSVAEATTYPTTIAYCYIEKDFPSKITTTGLTAANWELVGTPQASLTPTALGPRGTTITLNVTSTSYTLTNLLDADNDEWTLKTTAIGPEIYYKANTANGADIDPPPAKPDNVFAGGTALSDRGNIPVTMGQWGWGDWGPVANGDVGAPYNTIHLILPTYSGNEDPDDYYDGPKYSGGATYVQYGITTTDNNAFRSADVGKYVSIAGGLVEITSAGDNQVTGIVIATLNSTSEAVIWDLLDNVFDFTDDNLNPDTACFYEDRLWLGKNQTAWGSSTGQYERFIYGTADDNAVEFTILSRELTQIKWFEPRESLLIGTGGGVWKMDGGALDAAITPTNVNVKQITAEPSNATQALSVGSSVIYLHDQGQKLMQIEQDTDVFGKRAVDLSMLADHLTIGGLSQICYQSDPYGIIWAINGDGRLIGITFLKDQNVIAWHQHVTDGTVESIAVLGGASYDELWLVVKRNINGSDTRYIEVMQQFFERTGSTTLTNAIHSDAAITVTNSPASKTVSGLTKLEGETVTVLADGKRHRNMTVASGAITLDYAAEKIHVGLPYDQLIVSNYIEAAGGGSTTQGTQQRVIKVGTILNKTMVAEIGPDENNLRQVEIRKAADGLGTSTPLFTGIVETKIDGKYSTRISPTIFNDAPTPMTVVGLISTVEIGDN